MGVEETWQALQDETTIVTRYSDRHVKERRRKHGNIKAWPSM